MKYCSDISATWWCWWTSDRRPTLVCRLRTHGTALSHSHYLLPWLITSFALSLLYSFLNIMWDKLVFCGKLSKIKTRKQHCSPVSCLFFLCCAATDGALSVLEMGVDDRLQTMKGVWMLHPVVVGIIIHPLWFVLFFSFSHLFHAIFSTSLYSYSLFGSASPSPFSAFVLPVSRLFFSLQSVLVLSFTEIFKSPISSFSTILQLSVLPPFFNQHLPFPHSANLSPWNLSNSSCTHSMVPLIACSFTLPSSFPGSFCPGSLTIVGAYAAKQLSPAHRGV